MDLSPTNQIKMHPAFQSRVKQVGACLEWTACVNKKGYGQLHYKGKRYQAHRLAYEIIHGPMPAGLVTDHTCRNHACVEPGHLEAVTPHENTLRGTSPIAINADKTHCSKGHSYVVFGKYHATGGRSCHLCVKQRNAEYRMRKRAEKAARP